MKIERLDSQPLPAEWTGARLFIEKWLERRRVVDSLAQLVGGVSLVFAGLIALALTSGITSIVILFILFELNGTLGVPGRNFSLMRPFLFAVLFLFFMGLSILYAWRTRRDSANAARISFDSSLSSFTSLALEFVSAGPIFFVLAAQDFNKFARMYRMDVPPLSGLLLWLYDKNSRAGFAEVSLAFPGLNTVRVLPQMRDVSGVYWWPEEGEFALSEELHETLAQLLGRGPKNSPTFRQANETHHFESPAPEASAEMLSWYAALNLPPFATLQQVKTRYRKLAKLYHPDARARNSSTGGITDDEQMKRLNAAYHSILKHSQEQAGSFH